MVATSVDNLRNELAGLDDATVTERFRQLELEARRVEAELAVVVAEAETAAVVPRRRSPLDGRLVASQRQPRQPPDPTPPAVGGPGRRPAGGDRHARRRPHRDRPGRTAGDRGRQSSLRTAPRGLDRRVAGTSRATPPRRRQTLPGSLGDVRRPRRRPPPTRTRPRTPHRHRHRTRRDRPRCPPPVAPRCSPPNCRRSSNTSSMPSSPPTQPNDSNSTAPTPPPPCWHAPTPNAASTPWSRSSAPPPTLSPTARRRPGRSTWSST